MLRGINKYFQSVKGSDNKTAVQKAVDIKNGQIIKGVVLKKYPGGELLVSFGGRQFRASTALRLTEGREYHFQARPAGSKIELKLLDGLNSRLGLHLRSLSSGSLPRKELSGILAHLSNPRHFVSLSGKITEFIKVFQNNLASIIYNTPGNKDSLWISRYILGSGLFWENRTARYLLGSKEESHKKLIASDLKGLLMALEKVIKSENSEHDDINSIEMKTKQALNIIEQDQFLNLSSIREGLGWLLNLPSSGDNGFEKIEFFIKKGKGEGGIAFSIFLELTRLGSVDIKISIIESVMKIDIFAENSEKAEFINTDIPLLEKALKDKGISTSSIQCRVKDTEDDPYPDIFKKGTEHDQAMHLII